MNVLLFTTLHPNAVQPHHGVFIAQRASALAAGGCRVQVIAPVPRPPWPLRGLRRYRAARLLPERADWNGITVHHPRFDLLPALGWRSNPDRIARAALPVLRRILRAGFRPDVIDAHFLFPDGIAALRAGRACDLPVACTAHGSDLTWWPRRPAARAAILDLCRHAAVATVSASLKERLEELGADPRRVVVTPNAVDTRRFAPASPDVAGEGWPDGPLRLLSVGALIPRKGHDLTLQALSTLPHACLDIAGEGPERDALRRLAARLGVADRVRFLGAIPHAELPALYRRARLTVLASRREGMANVLLESLACGTPVVATAVDGTPEVIDGPLAGRLVPPDDPRMLSAAIASLLRQPRDPAGTRRSALRFDLRAATAAQIAWLAGVAGLQRRAA